VIGYFAAVNELQAVMGNIKFLKQQTTGKFIHITSAGLTMWQMWQMPRASGLRGASRSREIFSARSKLNVGDCPPKIQPVM